MLIFRFQMLPIVRKKKIFSNTKIHQSLGWDRKRTITRKSPLQIFVIEILGNNLL